jgi:hypothetical protein
MKFPLMLGVEKESKKEGAKMKPDELEEMAREIFEMVRDNAIEDGCLSQDRNLIWENTHQSVRNQAMRVAKWHLKALRTLRSKTRKEDAEIAQDDDNIVECDGANSYYCQLGDAKATSFKIARAILKKDKEERDGR